MKPFVVREHEVTPYGPANHTGTVNRRLIGSENVGASQIEVVLGTVEKRQGALPHAHPGIEQVCYMLSGRARVTLGEGAAVREAEIGPGDTCFFPADTMHTFTVTSEEPARVLVLYAPPYGENAARARTPTNA
jgi:uncharacterized RmlC-like cupin family protein